MLFCTWVKNSSSLRSLYLPLRSRQDLTATLRFRSSCPLRSHTEVYLAVILDKSRCVNRFCNRKCSLVASFHSTQIFFRLVSSSVPQKFCGLPQNNLPYLSDNNSSFINFSVSNYYAVKNGLTNVSPKPLDPVS